MTRPELAHVLRALAQEAHTLSTHLAMLVQQTTPRGCQTLRPLGDVIPELELLAVRAEAMASLAETPEVRPLPTTPTRS